MMKKFLAAFLAAALTAAMLVVSAAAADFSSVKSLESGKKTTVKLIEDGDYVNYKIKITKSGTLSVKLNSYMSALYVFAADSDEVPMKIYDVKSNTGYGSYRGSDHTAVQLWYNSDMGFYSGTISWKVKKGTYYIRLMCDSYGRNTDRKVTFTATYPSSGSKQSSPVLTINAKKGSTIEFGVADTNSNIEWSSSKKSVATVDRNGKVTVKGTGSAIITAKTGKKLLKIKIIVE